MCGICGIVQFPLSASSKNILPKMTSLLFHRGPDGRGIHVGGNFAFGHTRLAIIDLTEAGKQPFVDLSGRYVLTYNGELYNYLDLKRELIKLGCIFYTHTDTEVLMNAFITWGADCLDRLNGMFAFSIWDNLKQELFMARDRYGIKPCYYYNKSDLFAFSSEIKALFPLINYNVELEQEALVEYFTFQNIFTDKTFFKNIYMLPPGTYLKLNKHNFSNPILHKYWDFDFSEPQDSQSEEYYLENMNLLFRQAVRRQLVSDVDVGSYLSGGMDSGSITAIASQSIPNMRTFTVGFDLRSASGMELGYDEREKAEFMSYLFKTEHYEMVLKAGDMERAFNSLTWHLETPRVGQSYPNYYAAKLASKFNKVVLSGAGGDELFAGYPWRYYRAVVNDDFDHYIKKYYSFWQRLLDKDEFEQVFSPIWQNIRHVSTKGIFEAIFTKHKQQLERPEDYINHSLYFEAKTFLHGLLVVEDRLSMAHGLETRLPFLDNDLVDFAMKVPVKYKLNNLLQVVRLNENEPGPKTTKYFQKTNDGKLLLRRVMSRYIPTEITELTKQGFSAPDASWFKGESIDYVKDLLFNNNARIYDFLDKGAVFKLVNEHLQGTKNRRLLIWSLISFENWCQLFLNSQRLRSFSQVEDMVCSEEQYA